MSENRMRYVVSYDVEEDRLRSRVAKILEGTGFRVQKSVFECLLDAEQLDRLVARLTRTVGDREGVDLRIYRLCASCFAASFGLGDVARGTGGEPWVVV